MAIKNMTNEDQKRLIILVAIGDQNGDATKAEVLDFIGNEQLMKLYPDDEIMKTNRAELVWRNDLAFVRKHLVQLGYLSGAVRGRWIITDTGRRYLRQLLGRTNTVTHYNRLTEKVISMGLLH